jgi:hypothetical protein
MEGGPSVTWGAAGPGPRHHERMRARGTVAASVIVVGLGLGVLAALHPWSHPDPRRAHAGTAFVSIRTGERGPVVPPSFLGLSIEWDSVVPYTGGTGRRRAELLRVLAPVERAAQSPLALRIGGDTGDQAWWNPGGLAPRPPTVLQDVGPGTLNAISWLARGLGGPVTLGLNLALGDPANAQTVAAQARRRLPRGALAALEIGNEPDLYRHAHTFTSGGHVHRRLTKDPHYGVATYAREVGRYLRTLAQPSGPRLVVGGFAGPAWWPSLPRLLQGWGHRPGALAAHLYALPQCDAPTPSADWLMSSAASRDRVATLAPLMTIARRSGLPLRVSELNSAACGGRPHLSNSPAGALWLTDTLFSILRLGADGADVHTWRGASYAPFAVAAGHVAPRPSLEGMLAFARAAPAGSRLVDVTVNGGDDDVRAWATTDAHRVIRLALLAPDATRVAVASGGRTGCATVWRSPTQPRRAVCTRPTARRYAISLPPRSLAVITLPRPAGGRQRTHPRAPRSTTDRAHQAAAPAPRRRRR